MLLSTNESKRLQNVPGCSRVAAGKPKARIQICQHFPSTVTVRIKKLYVRARLFCERLRLALVLILTR